MKTNETEEAMIQKIKTQYNVPLQPGLGIELQVDGLCENPGAMHIGLYATQADQCLFAEHLAVGHGTCNIAEYVAVTTGLKLLQGVYPNPNVSVTVSSDSQLVVNQVNGRWKVSPGLIPYHSFLRRLRRTFPFELKQISREQNTMADGLAQRYIQKNSGRCLSIDNGRFNVSKQVPAVMKGADAYKALTSRAFRDHFDQHGLQRELMEVFRLANDGQTEEAMALAQDVRKQAAGLLAAAPATNHIVSQWVTNAHALIEKTVDLMVAAIAKGDAIDLQYLIEELSGAPSPTSEFWQPDDIAADREFEATSEEANEDEFDE